MKHKPFIPHSIIYDPLHLAPNRWLVEIVSYSGAGVSRHYFENKEEAQQFVTLAREQGTTHHVTQESQNEANLLRRLFGRRYHQQTSAETRIHAKANPEQYERKD